MQCRGHADLRGGLVATDALGGRDFRGDGIPSVDAPVVPIFGILLALPAQEQLTHREQSACPGGALQPNRAAHDIDEAGVVELGCRLHSG